DFDRELVRQADFNKRAHHEALRRSLKTLRRDGLEGVGERDSQLDPATDGLRGGGEADQDENRKKCFAHLLHWMSPSGAALLADDPWGRFCKRAASLASSSHRLLSEWLAWPLVQVQVTRWISHSRSSSSHRS